MLYISVHTMQSSTIVRLEGSQKKIFPLCAFFSLLQFRSPNEKVRYLFLSLMLNIVCTAEVGAAVWGTPSNLCHNYKKMM